MSGKIAEVNNPLLFDSNLGIREDLGTFKTLEAAEARAREAAESDTEDAAVLFGPDDQGADTYRVVTTQEIDRFKSFFTDNAVHEGASDLVGVFGGNAGKGVSLRRSSDNSTYYDKARVMLAKAGLSEAEQKEMLSARLNPERAATLLQLLLERDNPLDGFGPQAIVVKLLSDAVSGRRLNRSKITHEYRKHRHLVILRPDGYLAQATTGKAIVKQGQPGLNEEGWLSAGGMEVGAFRYNRDGVFYAIDDQLRPTGPPLDELGIETGPVLDGVGIALRNVAQGIAQLVTQPGETLAALGELPHAMVAILKNSPEYYEKFRVMPADDKVRTVSHLLYSLALLRIPLKGAGLGEGVGQGAQVLSKLGDIARPMIRVTPQGAVAVDVVAVQSAALIRAAEVAGLKVLGEGGRALTMMAMSRNDVEGLSRISESSGSPQPAPIKKGKHGGKLRPLRAKQVVSGLKKNGFQAAGGKGSHLKLKHPDGRKTVVPMHQDVAKGTLSSILKQAGLRMEDLF